MSTKIKTQDVVDEQTPLIPEASSSTTDTEAAATEPEKRSLFDTLLYLSGGVVLSFLLALLVRAVVASGDVEFDYKKALKRALGGGITGAAAMFLQVLLLMPIRTVMNYQYRYGTSMTQAIQTLYADGGWTRYYQGLSAALIQGPISRFGDTAANEGVRALLNSNPTTNALPDAIKSLFASVTAALFRIILTPIDTVKTTLQAQGKDGLTLLRKRVQIYGITSLWYGALATFAATLVGHYPWFGTLNFLNTHIPEPDDFVGQLLRYAFIGFVASVISDTVSNSVRVVKTYRQVNDTRISYTDAAKAIIATDGLRGLFGRGLKTRILANGLQGLMFTVLWRFFLKLWERKA